VNWIEAVPLGELRLAGPLVGLFVLGVCVGGLLNLGIYRLAWHARTISPWSAPPSDGPPRRWSDRLPVVGWLGLRRESAIHGWGFWIRPMLVELVSGVGFAALYWWEIDRLGLMLPGVPRPSTAVLHATCAAHLVLVSLMLVASLIDCDEKTIPDAITVPGTLAALLAAAICPWSLLPDTFRQVSLGMLGNLLGPPPAPPAYDFLRLTSPNPWDNWLDGFPRAWPLLIGLACWWLWCVALTHRTWYARHGWLRAFELMCARLRREASTWHILRMGLIGSAVVAVVWRVGGDYWAGLLSALVGMVAGGGIIWAIRIIGSAVLRREAMGFGDVTLMAMIGAFLGWQPCLVIIFLAPFAGLVVGLISLILRRGPEIPFGPFLCMATLVVIVGWTDVWEWSSPIFGLGGLLILVVLICLILMVPLLVLSRLVRTLFFG
jgi:leader peptidase (prepilin peptidase)/N-methyltransferase